jgi:hypothetical protein
MLCSNCRATIVVSPSDTQTAVLCGNCGTTVREGHSFVDSIEELASDLTLLPPHLRQHSISREEIFLPAPFALAAIDALETEGVAILQCVWYVGSPDAFRSWPSEPPLPVGVRLSTTSAREAIRESLAVFSSNSSSRNETLYVAIEIKRA